MPAPHCLLHAYIAWIKKKKREKRNRTCTPTPELKWWCSTCFSVNKRGHAEKEKEGESETAWEMARRREKELESKGLTAGWYSWGLAREADGAEWTSPRNFNVDGTACCCQSRSASLYITNLTVLPTAVYLMKQREQQQKKIIHGTYQIFWLQRPGLTDVVHPRTEPLFS